MYNQCRYVTPTGQTNPNRIGSNVVPSETLFILEYIWECLALDAEQHINLTDLSYEIPRDAPGRKRARIVYFYWVYMREHLIINLIKKTVYKLFMYGAIINLINFYGNGKI